jgi:hypothetical protein
LYLSDQLPFGAPRPAGADPLSGANGKLKVQPVVPLQVRPFSLQDVRLLPGPFKHAMDLDHEYLLSLDVERLLHTFRINAGLPSQAQPLGGWEAPECELRGHFVGHYLSGCAMMYASIGDTRLKEKVDAVVAGLAECQAKLGNGYLSAYPESFIDRVEKRSQFGPLLHPAQDSSPACLTPTNIATMPRPWKSRGSLATGSLRETRR